MDKLDPVSRIKIKRGENKKKNKIIRLFKKNFFFQLGLSLRCYSLPANTAELSRMY